MYTRTGAATEPKPFVLQTSVDDYYVAYQINALNEKLQDKAIFTPNCIRTYKTSVMKEVLRSFRHIIVPNAMAMKPPFQKIIALKIINRQILMLIWKKMNSQYNIL